MRKFDVPGVGILVVCAAIGLGVSAANAQTSAPSEPAAAASAAAATDRPVTDAQVLSTATVANEPAPAVQPTTAAPVPENEVVALVRERLKKGQSAAVPRDKDDRTALAQFYDQRLASGPVWTDGDSINAAGQAIIDVIAKADAWGLRARDFDLPAAAKLASLADRAEAELKISTAALKYARHARGGRVDPTELSEYLDRKATLVPPRQVIDAVAASDAPDGYLLKLHPAHPQFERLRQKLLALTLAAPAAETEPAAKAEAPAKKGKGPKRDDTAQREEPAPRVTAKKLIANMEMWRWMPVDLGRRHVFANVPEFTFRYMKDGAAIHTERIVTGKTDTQTPIFSEKMDHIIFHPTWNVPDSIKVKELLPGLARGSNSIARQGLRATLDGRPVDPSSVDWSSVDIRRMHVYQPSGQGNALGLMKFMFPNKHAVYMHDTPSKPLFNAASRAFSHGCVRVRNPARFAEVILSEDKGWGPDKVKALIDTPAENNQITLTTKIPVHMAYFTTWVDDAGQLTSYRDVYGYEERIQLGLDGKASQIVKRKENLGQIRADVVGRLSEARAKSGANAFDWIKQIFGN